MPLSDHEQRLLEQMEQQLLSDDPRFASTMRGPRTAPAARRRFVIGIGGVVVGLAVLVLGVVVKGNWLLAIPAFVIMLAGLVYASSAGGVRASPTGSSGPTGVVGADGRATRRPSSGHGSSAAPRTKGGSRHPRGTFMQRLEQRWDRRRDDRWH